jgi:hypothetical protein
MPSARAVIAEVGLAQPAIDVVAAEPAHQSCGERHFLERGVRRHERSHRRGTVMRDDIAEPVGDVFERRRPIDGLPFAAVLDERRRKPVLGVQRLVREAVLVREPALVDRFVVERQHAHHAIVLHLHDQVAAVRVVRRDALAPR